MKERPILFSTPMVQAILEGRKTMTRRVVKFPKDFTGESVYDNSPYGLKYSNSKDTIERMACPYGEPGDHLWVRETFNDGCIGEYIYAANRNVEELTRYKLAGYKWKPSIFMPRKASRITLLIKSIRVERLQDVTDSDCLNEGVIPKADNKIQSNTEHFIRLNAIIDFKNVWESINGKGSWESNPWVWVIEFEGIKP